MHCMTSAPAPSRMRTSIIMTSLSHLPRGGPRAVTVALRHQEDMKERSTRYVVNILCVYYCRPM